jgi:hypothetical protein
MEKFEQQFTDLDVRTSVSCFFFSLCIVNALNNLKNNLDKFVP